MKYSEEVQWIIHDAITDRSGGAPWMMDDLAQFLNEVGKKLAPPFNPITGTEYSGVNTVMLQCCGSYDPRWLTYKQIKSAGYSLKKGAYAVTISYSKTQEKTETGEYRKLDKPQIFYYNVFNAEYINGISPYEQIAVENKIGLQTSKEVLDRVERASEALNFPQTEEGTVEHSRGEMINLMSQYMVCLRNGIPHEPTKEQIETVQPYIQCIQEAGTSIDNSPEIPRSYIQDIEQGSRTHGAAEEMGLDLIVACQKAEMLTEFCMRNEKHQEELIEAYL